MYSQIDTIPTNAYVCLQVSVQMYLRLLLRKCLKLALSEFIGCEMSVMNTQ